LVQTFTDFECILIDDGSPDACPAICDEYAKRDKRIIVIHQENKGVSAARNAGLDIAKGEWIAFVDSDDWCDEGMFQFLYDNARKYDADVSICGVRNVSSNGCIFQYTKRGKLLCNGITATRVMLAGKLFDTSPFAKLMRADIFIKNKLRYDIVIKCGEDAFLLYEFFKCTNKIFFSSMPYYNYFHHSDSITGLHELTEARKTVFMAYNKMLYLETNKTIKRQLKSRKAREAYWMAMYYLLKNNCSTGAYMFLQNIIRANFIYVLTDFTLSIKKRSQCLLSLYPKLWHSVYNIFLFTKRLFI
jgi:glycosyltransferase involved in cell wall biosynthesis